ncbi:hypothetical protein O4J56_24775 [Nocardiopsis sp. RSe5-2]|uniref:Uncharacterized protein n=1 Tax=Nocardiopsis endophytica TaxID=3018445 RepID=A0ABT4UC65_9ACTN|nr:hypothetical protein [Nocardiopsis endophytica]MDA2813882.1 hypothetical protein [Nocardiopsis endophytica]
MDDLGMSWLAWLVSVIAAVAIPAGVILLVVGLLTYARRDAERRGGRSAPEDGGTDAATRGEGDDGPEPGGGEPGPEGEAPGPDGEAPGPDGDAPGPDGDEPGPDGGGTGDGRGPM